MKYLLLLSLTIMPLTTFSKGKERDEHKEFEKKMEKMTFEEAKKTKLDMLDRKSSMIDDERKCIKDTKDKSEISKCMKVMKEAKQSMKEEKMNY
ncbi:MAG: hypothetical protein ACXVLQ_06525 [Bacteriovorax sp.]